MSCPFSPPLVHEVLLCLASHKINGILTNFPFHWQEKVETAVSDDEDNGENSYVDHFEGNSLSADGPAPSPGGPFSALTPSMWPQDILSKLNQQSDDPNSQPEYRYDFHLIKSNIIFLINQNIDQKLLTSQLISIFTTTLITLAITFIDSTNSDFALRRKMAQNRAQTNSLVFLLWRIHNTG